MFVSILLPNSDSDYSRMDIPLEANTERYQQFISQLKVLCEKKTISGKLPIANIPYVWIWGHDKDGNFKQDWFDVDFWDNPMDIYRIGKIPK